MPPIARRPKPEREADIQDATRVALSRQGLVRVRRNAQATRPLPGGGMVYAGLGPGTSDLIGWVKRGPYGGRTFALEMKRPGEKPSEEQEKFLREVNEDGGYGCWADSVEMALEHAARAARGERA